MFAPVATNDLPAVRTEVQAAYIAMFPLGDYEFVFRVFGWVEDCFAGRHPDFQAIDARYHDLEHTLQGTLCMTRLLRGRHAAGTQPKLTQRLFELGLIGILLHDTGYLKRRDDTAGTIYESHFAWQIRTFWWGLLWAVLGFLTVWLLVGFAILFANFVWCIYRIVKGFLNWNDGKPMVV